METERQTLSSFIACLQQFLTAPVSKQFSPKGVFWFSLSLTFAAIYGILGLQQAFGSEYVVSSDAQLHVFWLRRFQEPSLFPNDLLANFLQSLAPWGYTAIHWLGTVIRIDPLLLSKILPFVLGLVTTAYCFGICLEIIPVPAAGLFYPSCVFVSVGILLLQLVRWQGRGLSFSRNQQDYWLCAAGMGVAFLVLLPYAFKSYEFGEAIMSKSYLVSNIEHNMFELRRILKR